MGLDMYLYKAKKQKGKTFEEVMEIRDMYNNGELALEEKMKLLPYLFEEKNGDRYLLKNIYYWRKANAIHNWFVVNIQCGNDDQNCYRVEKRDLEVLLDTLRDVYKSLINKELVKEKRYDEYTKREYEVEVYKNEDLEVAESLLPTQDGFFFGVTEYDKYYFDMIERTLDDLEIIYNTMDWENNYLIYSCWW